MNENEPVEAVAKRNKSNTPPRGGAPKKIIRRSFEERLRAVKLHLEEGFTVELVAREMGVSYAAVSKWLQKYRREGEEGLRDHDPRTGRPKIPEPVREKIVELKSVVASKTSRERRPADITIFKSNGMAVEDVICAGYIYERGIQEGRGAEMRYS
jgi:transposase-like protein